VVPPKPWASTPTRRLHKSKPRVRAYMIGAPCRRAATARRARNRGTASAEPGPRTSLGPPLGNRQPEPRNDPRQHYRSGQGPIDDVAMQSLIPDRHAGSLGEEIRPSATHPKSIAPPGFASSREKPSTPSQVPHLPRKKMSLPAPACRGASPPVPAVPWNPNPLPARRETRLRPSAKPPALSLTPASPLCQPL